MERNDLHDLELALGIQQPWAIKSVRVNDEQNRFDVELELQDKKRLFGFLDSHKKETGNELAAGHWHYLNIGTYATIVHANVPRSATAAYLNDELICMQAFLGHPARQYSNFIRQQVSLAQLKGLDVQAVADTYGLSESTLKAIGEDYDKASVSARALAFLPTEIDNIWARMLADQMKMKTNHTALKFLLSKLKLAASKTNDPRELQGLKTELRKFFVEHASLLESEIEQVCGFDNSQMRSRVRAAATRQKLILPALKSPLWIDLLTGKLNLNSQSIPLNLLLSRQRSAFVQGHTSDEKSRAVSVLREYFRKNYRSLKTELVLLNRAMDIQHRAASKSSVSLPDVEHIVWQKILEEENYVPSNHVAYKLLLAKLRAQVSTKPDPVIKLEAAHRIRDFLRQNQKAMRNEVGFLMQRVATV